MRLFLTLFTLLRLPKSVNYIDCERRGFNSISWNNKSISGTIDTMEEIEKSIDKSKYLNQSAFVLGYTGEVGSELVRILLEKKIFGNLVLIGRREVDFSAKGELYKSGVTQKQVDFEELNKHRDAFSECSVGFCCLGTTRAKAGADGFVKVDHDYVLSSAKVAKEAGCTNFNLVTSKGANAASYILYLSTKGKVENAISELKYPTYTVFRPATLLVPGGRKEARLGEKMFIGLLKPVSAISPTFMTVPVEYVAKSIVLNLFTRDNEKEGATKFVENPAIHEMSKSFDRCFK